MGNSRVRRVKLRPSIRATMKIPGRTQWSCAVSKIRIRFSSSSNFIVPLLDDKVLRIIHAHIVWFVELSGMAG